MAHLTDEQLIEAIRSVLRKSKTLGLATVDQRGEPHAANVNFVTDEELNLYWLSKPESKHSMDLAAQPRVAGTAYPAFRLPNRIRGVQLRGEASGITEDRFDELWKRYCTKFPYARAIKKKAQEDRFYCLKPRWLRLIDNTLGFGFKAELDWPVGFQTVPQAKKI